ncbi:MAG: lacto-N-biose phosphorylase central domain-containing protein, partial [Phycisphaerales bacterium]
DVKVLINSGIANSSWCGGVHWKNKKVIEKITEWVAHGGGFIGIGEPSACEHAGQYFQLSHILGVDKAIGLSLSKSNPVYKKTDEKHFITEDIEAGIDFGKDIDNIFLLSKDVKVLIDKEDSPRIATNNYNKGRAIYLSGYKFTPQNTRLLHRALYWAANHESNFTPWTCSNINTECAYYPKNKKLVVINNSDKLEETKVFDSNGKSTNVKIQPHGIEIINL